MKRKKSIIYFIIVIILVLVMNIFISRAYYNSSNNYSIIHSKITNIIPNYDYILLIYKEDENNLGTYIMVDSIPNDDYVFNSYNCLNNSELIYDSVNKVTSVSINKKELCEIYFNIKKGEI